MTSIVETFTKMDILSLMSFFANFVTSFGIIVIIVQFFIYKKNQREKDKDTKAQSYQNRYELYAEMDKMLVSKPYLKKLISNKELVTEIKLGNVDINKIEELAFIEMVLNICQLSFFQFQNKRSDSGLSWTRELLQNEYVIEYWRSGYRCKFTEDFEDFVTNEIKNGTAHN